MKQIHFSQQPQKTFSRTEVLSSSQAQSARQSLFRINASSFLHFFYASFLIAIYTLNSIGALASKESTNRNQVDSSSNSILAGTYKITAKHSGKVLDVYHILTDNGVPVVQWDYVGSLNQRWQIQPVDDIYYKITVVHTGKSLDVAGVSQENAADVIQWDSHGGDNQLWRIEFVGDGYYKIVAKHSGKALDVHGASNETGARIIQHDYLGGDNQKWRFETVGSEPQPSPQPTPSPTPTPEPSPGQLSDRVLVVYNSANQESDDVARYYASRRSIPNVNLCAISPSDTYGLAWSQYLEQVRNPIQNCLNRVGRERILYIVFSYQTPYQVWNVPVDRRLPSRALAEGDDGDFNAIDQHVADIWEQTPPNGPQGYYGVVQSKNNLYPTFQSLSNYRLQSNAQMLYSVWRLDAKNKDLAEQLVDRALEGERLGLQGQACFDRNRGHIFPLWPEDRGYLTGDWDLYRAAQFARDYGFATTEDGHEQEFGQAPAPIRCDNAALYSGWYSLNNYNDAFSWAPGAIGFHLDSASAANPRGGPNWSANAVEKGITITAGAMAEPYLQYMPHPDSIFRNLFEGANIGDALLRSLPYVRWRILQIGDPLYRPFPNSTFPVATSALPAPWRSGDVGLNPTLLGNSEINARGLITVNGVGDQMWYDRDRFHFASQKLIGDGEIVARVVRCEASTWDAQAGLMIRESSADDSRYLSLSTGCGNRKSLVRANTGGDTNVVGEQAHEQHSEWLKLVRTRNTVTGYYSADGQVWNQFVQRQLTLSAGALIGLYSYAGTTVYRNRAVFDQVATSGTIEPATDYNPPTININGRAGQTSAAISITAQDAESGVKNIYYSLDGTNFNLHTNPFNLNFSQNNPVIVYSFAEDQAGNRSNVVSRSFQALGSGPLSDNPPSDATKNF